MAPRRVGSWDYISGEGWRLRGTNIVIDRCGNYADEYRWQVVTGPRMHEPLGMFMDAAMAEVEAH